MCVDASWRRTAAPLQGDAYAVGRRLHTGTLPAGTEIHTGDTSAQTGNSVRAAQIASGFTAVLQLHTWTVRGTEDALRDDQKSSDNAIKYNHPGGYAKVAVGWTVPPSQKKGLLLSCPFISVEDNGIGMKEDKPTGSLRDFTASIKSLRATGGTGLGLSIVKHAALLQRV